MDLRSGGKNEHGRERLEFMSLVWAARGCHPVCLLALGALHLDVGFLCLRSPI